MGIDIDEISELVSDICTSTEKLREEVPIEKIAEQIDGVSDDLKPILAAIGRVLERWTTFQRANVREEAEFRAGLVRSLLNNDRELSEETALLIVTDVCDDASGRVRRWSGLAEGRVGSRK